MLYIDIDKFKERDFEVIIYHNWEEVSINIIKTISDVSILFKISATGYIIITKRFKIRFIMFLNRLLTDTKKNY